MCAKCGFPGEAAHWADAGAATPRDRREAKARRLELLQAVLGPRGVKVEHSALAFALRLSAPGAAPGLAASLDDLWPLVERMLGAPLDPLSPHFVDSPDSR